MRTSTNELRTTGLEKQSRGLKRISEHHANLVETSPVGCFEFLEMEVAHPRFSMPYGLMFMCVVTGYLGAGLQ